MKFQIALTGVFLMLAACGGSGTASFGGGGAGGGGGDAGGGDVGGGLDDPAELPVDPTDNQCSGSFTCSGDVRAVSYDSASGVLTLSRLPFDDDPVGATYNLIGQLNGFDIYENNDPAVFNRYLALHNTSPGGELTVGVASIENYQDYGYTGAWYQLNDLSSTIPSAGLVRYSGDYAGLMTFLGSGDLYTTRGDLELRVDFTDSYLKGSVSNRTYDTDPVGPAGLNDVNGSLPTLVLNDTIITDGSFSGTVNSYDGAVVLESGTYQGFFGGSDASVVGGIIQAFNPRFAGDPDAVAEEDQRTSRDLGTFIGTCVGQTPGC